MSVYEKVGGEFAVEGEDAGDELAPQVTALADGRYLITWIAEGSDSMERVIKGQLYDASGAKDGGEFLVSLGDPANIWGSSTATLADGGFIVTWVNHQDEDNGAGGVIARRFDADGNAVGEQFTVNEAWSILQQNAQVNTLSNGGFVVTWDDQSTQRAQIFDGSGARVGDEFATTGVGYNGFGDAIALAGGGFVVSWRAGSTYDVYARIFDNAGAAVGSEFRLNTLTANDQYSQNLTALADGGFVALWESWGPVGPGNHTEIKGQLFDATGAKVGAEFQVNQQTAGLQRGGEATALADGGFIVTWTTFDQAQDGSGSASMARQYGADGMPVGGEFQMNATTADYQRGAELAAFADGRVLAVWATSDNWGDNSELNGQFLYTSANAAPEITSDDGGASASFTIAENATAVTTVAAADADGPQTVTYWIGGGADAGLFVIDKTTGALSFAAGPDFESPADADEDGVYEVIVEARDGLSVDTQAISVAVTDLSDGLSFRYTSLTALENGLAGPTLLALGGAGAPVSYTIVGGADAALLALDAQTGELSFLAEQNFESPGDAYGDGVYEVQVTADDGTSSVTRTISVALGNVNEGQAWVSSPEFTVAENEYYVGTVAASDVDGDELSYYITGGADGALFSIDDFGVLGFYEPADFEAPADADGDNVYEVEIVAYDGELAEYQTVYVTVTDADDPVPPSFVQTAFEVSEIVFFSAALELAGAPSDVYYSISGGDDGWLFDIDSYTGELITIYGGFDYETPYDSDGDNLYEVEVEAYDYNSGETVTATVTVAVRDAVNEELFFVTGDTWAAVENETYVGAVLAYDAQFDALTYSVTGGADGALFTIVPETGELFFLTAPVLSAPGDADGDNVYELEVAVSDGMSTEYQTLTVTLGDVDEPGFAQTAFTTDENQAASAFLVPSTNSDWIYSITDGADAGQFVLDAVTGEITFLGGDYEQPYDADGDNVYEVEVTANSSSGTVSGLVTFAVQNVDEAPDVMTWPISINENSLNGGWVYAWDPENLPLTYAIAGGADGGLFTIDSNTGFLRFTAAADFEAPADADGNNVYDVIVEVSDGSLSTTGALTVTVQNVGEAPVITSNGGGAAASLTVNENSTAVTTVAASDPDGGVTYSLVAGGDAARFAINASTGALTFVAAPNYEAPSDGGADNVYNVTVRASDGSLTDTQALAITVANLNETPVITSNGGGASAAISVSENATAVSTVTSTDPEGGTRTYSLAGGADAALFAIDSVTGALSFVTAPDFDAPADANGDNVYEVIVSASDGSLADTQAISVTVGNVNEGVAITSPASASVLENGTAVTTVTAADVDGDAVVFAIAGGADAASFAIDAATGTLSFITAPDYDAPADAGGDNVYDVVVSASDGSLTDTQALAITVGNVNEGPVITSNGGGASAALSVLENGTAVTTVAVNDAAGAVTFSVVGGEDSEFFTIDASTGMLSFNGAPDFDNPSDFGEDNVYEVVVRASDGIVADTQALSITVGDVEEAPVILSTTDSLNENHTFVGSIWAGDSDNDPLTYSVVGGADGGLFTVNWEGKIYFRAAPDFEAPGDADGDNVYELTVGVSDGTTTTTGTMTVTVNNLNEAPDIVSNGGSINANVAVTENTTAVTTVIAADPEGGVTYSLAGDDAALFTLDAATGVLSFAAAPDFEAPADSNGDNRYDLMVTASDGTFSAFQYVYVQVGDVNEGVTITSPASAAALENGTAVATVTASDLDGDAVSYALAGGADAALFAIDAATGALSFVSLPDFEAPADADGDNVYDVVVSASDGALDDTQALSVTVGNVNEAPTIVSDGGGTSAALELDEGQTAVTTVVAADPDGPGALTYSITGGPDAALFAIDSATGALTLVAAPDYEAPADFAEDNFYTVTVTASDGELSTFQAISVMIRNVNEGVTITSAPSAAVSENTAAVTTVTATDLDGDTIAFEIAGGADAARFAIDAASGALTFVSAPNFEAPTDADGDNVYEVLVSASDGTLSDTQALAVTIGNVNEAPVITSGGGGTSVAYTLDENATAVATIAAGDAEGGVTYALAGGADAARFAIDAVTGALTFVAAPDFDAPADAGADNVYDVIVSASDGSLTDTQALAITVGNVSDGLTLTGTSQANTLTGSYEEDSISGLGGNDTLRGLAAADVLNGGDGQDRLFGGTGADVLTGGAKADVFEFETLSDSTTAASDRILDFTRSQGDKIELFDIDANTATAGNQAFSFIGTAAFSNQAGQLRSFQQGGDTFIAGDVDGNGAADFQIVVDPLVSFIASDFIL